MKLRRPRLTLRWLMIAVTVAAAILAGWRLRALSLAHRATAAMHALEEAAWKREARTYSRMVEVGELNYRVHEQAVEQNGGRVPSGVRNEADFFRPAIQQAAARARFHGGMKAKYDRAARYPWLTVAPDPPAPE